jgi:hypothetical protein
VGIPTDANATEERYFLRSLCRDVISRIVGAYIIKKYACNKQKSHEVMKMLMFAIQDKAKPDTETI